MEAIREYLNNLFMSLPETPEVLRAKAELLEMMEDKYEELIQEGKTEQEAVGIVISEFGNLEELAEELGIDFYLKKGKKEMEEEDKEKETGAGRQKEEPPQKGYRWNFEEVRQYISYAWCHAGFIAAGVMLCIWAPFLESVFAGAVEAGYLPEIVGNAMGTTCFFLMIALAVMLFVGASGQKKRYGNVSRFYVMLEEKGARFVSQKREKDENSRLTMRIMGIALCILSVVPSSVNWFQNALLSAIVDSSVLFIVGIGVFFLVLSCSVGNRYEELEKAVKNAKEQENIEYVDDVFEGHRKRKISVGIICCFVFGGFLMMAGLMGVSYLMYPSSSSSEEIQNEVSFDPAGVSKIQADLDIGDFCVERTDTEKIQIKYNGQSSSQPEVTQENGVLRIREKSRGFHLGFFAWNFPKGKRTVTLLVPSSLSLEGEKRGVSYQIDMDAGNVFLDGAAGETLNVNVDAGNVEGERCVFYGKSKVEVDAGNADFKLSHFTDLKAEVDCGNFALETHPAPLSCYDLVLDTDLGDIHVNGEKVGNSYQTGAKDENAVSGKLDIEVDLGNIELSEDS